MVDLERLVQALQGEVVDGEEAEGQTSKERKKIMTAGKMYAKWR